MTHDYEAAIEDLQDDTLVHRHHILIYAGHKAAILHALKLAAKVTGEPSVDMTIEGRNTYLNASPYLNPAADMSVAFYGVFKAMIAQAQKEIE